ncbi:hypothetical protein B0H21DRAFT_722433 [Amylocystis lapponica]|nr:hypothetical protein B0H21DRAFT_722433 [Amylocystis lapponica]
MFSSFYRVPRSPAMVVVFLTSQISSTVAMAHDKTHLEQKCTECQVLRISMASGTVPGCALSGFNVSDLTAVFRPIIKWLRWPA